MYKNQLQELAQRSCFNLPSYSGIREGPDHAPRFKASVNFNGEIFDSPNYCTTLRQAEHSAAEIALNVLSTRGPSSSLTARVLDETGIYKNLLQETAHRAGLKLPVYTTVRSGPGHVPTFTCSVQLAGMSFTGEAAKTKKQAEKNAAIAAWSSLKRNLGPNIKEAGESSGGDQEQQEQAVVARMLSNIRLTSKEDHRRQLRRRPDHHHQTQARRRTVMMRAAALTPPHSHRDINASTSTTNSLVQNLQHWRLIDELLTDLVPQVSSSNPQKQSSFASLLPPPPPRTESKILPPEASIRLNKSDHSSSSYYNSSTSSSYKRPIPVQLRTSPQVTVAPPFEEHQRDEEEWLGIKSSIIKMMSSIEKEEDHSCSSSSSSSSSPKPSNYFSSSSGSGMFGSSNCTYNSRQFPPTRSNLYSHRVAPAVQIRSVIPVCAAPPQPQPPRAVVVVRPSSSSSVTPLASATLLAMPRMREPTTPSTSTDSMSAAAAAASVLKESGRFYMTDRAEQVATETETETVRSSNDPGSKS